MRLVDLPVPVEIIHPFVLMVRRLDEVILLRSANGTRKEMQKAVWHRLVVTDEAGEIRGIRKRLHWIQAGARSVHVRFRYRSRRRFGSARVCKAKIHAAFECMFAFSPADRIRV